MAFSINRRLADVITSSGVIEATIDPAFAAQPNITSLGTLTTLSIDNITINTNDISSTGGTDLTITPLSGQQIVLDGTIVIDAGVVTGATSITSTAFVGALTGNVTGNASGTALTVTQAAQTAITSLGTLTSLNVDSLNLNGSSITSSSNLTLDVAGDINLDAAGNDIVFKFDGTERLRFNHDSGDINIDATGNIRLDAEDNGEIRFLDGGTQYLYIKKDGNNALLQSQVSDGNLIFGGNDGGSLITAMTINMSVGGFVGIGETAPANLLHVKASDTGIAPHASAQIVLEREGTNYLQFLTAENGTSGILFGDGSDVDVSKIFVDHNTAKMTFVQEANETMTLYGGNVGIGTSSINLTAADRTTVEIDGTTSALLSLAVNGTSKFYNYTDANGTNILHSSGYLRFSTAGTNERMRILANGNVGIGTAAPSRTLTIDNDTLAALQLVNATTGAAAGDGFQMQLSSDDGYIFNYEPSGHIYIGTAAATRMTILNTGNVGIGHTTPTAGKLVIDSILAGDAGIIVSQPQNNIGVRINQTGNNAALSIDSNATGDGAIEIWSKYGIQSIQDISGGQAGYFARDISEAGSNPLVEIKDDNANNTQTALKIQQDGGGKGIHIDQNGDQSAIYIDSEAGNYQAIKIDAKYGLFFTQTHASGYGAYFYRNTGSEGSPLVTMIDDHTSSNQALLNMRQDGTGNAITIDQNGNSNVIYIDTEHTTSNGIFMDASTLTTGNGIYVYSNSSDTGAHTLLKLVSDHTSAVGSSIIYAQQDAAASCFLGTAGAVAHPTYSFIGDANTGISKPTSAAVNIITGGVERLRVDSSGRVGISRTPSASYSKLEVGGADNTALINAEASGVFAGLGVQNSGLGLYVNNSYKLVILSGGNVGIGTSSPDYILEMESSASNHTTGPAITNAQTGGYGSALNFVSRRSDNSVYTIAARIRTEGGDSWNTDASTDSTLKFETVSANTLATKMTILHDGKVGIGTTSPGNVLEVKASGNDQGIKLKSTNNSDLIWLHQQSTSEGVLRIYGSGGAKVIIPGHNSPTYFNNGNNFGIGTASPGKKLDVTVTANTDGIRLNGSAANTSFIINNTGTGGVAWDISSTGAGHGYGNGGLHFGVGFGEPKMAIKSDGLVGIGTYTPKATFHVDGTIYNTNAIEKTSTSTSSWTTICTITSSANYSILLSTSENSHIQMWRLSGSSVHDTLYAEQVGDQGHAHSKDATFRMDGNDIQYKNVSYTTARALRVYHIMANSDGLTATV